MVDELIKWIESALGLAETLRFCVLCKSAKLQASVCYSDVSWLSSTATGVDFNFECVGYLNVVVCI